MRTKLYEGICLSVEEEGDGEVYLGLPRINCCPEQDAIEAAQAILKHFNAIPDAIRERDEWQQRAQAMWRTIQQGEPLAREIACYMHELDKQRWAAEGKS